MRRRGGWGAAGWVVALATVIGAAGCATISPPPMVMRHDGPAPMEAGQIEVMLVVGLGLGIFIDGGPGVLVRVLGQIDAGVALGGEVGAGFNIDHTDRPNPGNHPGALFVARGLGRFNPAGQEVVAVEGGLGLGLTSGGLLALTANTGALVGEGFALGKHGEGAVLTPYGGPALAVSVPLRQGEPIYEVDLSSSTRIGPPKTVTTTWILGATLGLRLESAGEQGDPLGGSLEGSWLYAWSDGDEAVLLGLSAAPSLTLAGSE